MGAYKDFIPTICDYCETVVDGDEDRLYKFKEVKCPWVMDICKECLIKELNAAASKNEIHELTTATAISTFLGLAC